ncbi:iron chelate uptake ABC transporter, solute-binding protein [Alteracholeplasma palmae J233]|uniref:Iron chelate uptake ABC transporter, solute-binding protein n=1 Tax=Alteracholeplasma palmae (strain ATCC 49389 / J233) TaxID=1318466 RepID=U4KPI2_ALTPJ|nr:ABC transporter substrate-binding protein [Alteracholeplasma palmae]CCV64155.1 iron chelate uptake ABC transporter, solute-binding protein [Alteracholeplasma palmae J233]
MKKVLTLIVALVAAITLVACNNSSKRTGETVEITQTISVDTGEKNSKGETVYKKEAVTQKMFINPKRVVTFALGVADMLDTVGIEKAGITTFALPKSNLPVDLSKFNDEKYINAGTLFDASLDQLNLMDPELIVLDGRSLNLYSSLKKQYPQADILNASNTSYTIEAHKENVLNLGKLFPSVKSDLEKEMTIIETKFNEINEVAKQHQALFLLSNGKALSVFGKGTSSRYNVIHKEFGFQDARATSGQEDAGSHGVAINLEALTNINPEVIFILDRAAATNNESGLANLKNEEQFKKLDAVKAGKVYDLNPGAWYLVTGGFQSTKTMIADIQVYIDSLAN